MNPEEKKPRRHSPAAGTTDTILVQFTTTFIPGDSPESLARERKGRPARSPSLPPEDSQQDEAASSK